MISVAGNILAASAPPESGEYFESIGSIGGVRIERILSSATPDTGLQSQPHHEWVLLARGRATLGIVDASGAEVEVVLVPGDWQFIAADTVHRVVATEAGTVWLALHAPPPAADMRGG